MARKKTDSQPTGKLVCDTCQMDMGAEMTTNYGKFPGWSKGPVLHCEGSTTAFGCRRVGIVHHGHRIYDCPECGFHLGCTHCVGLNPVCTRCQIFANGDKIMPREIFYKRVKEVYETLDKVKPVLKEEITEG